MTRDVTRGSVTGHLIRLTIPTIGGFIAITVFNLTDTYFVSRLGTEALAAMGFTFPVVMITGAAAMGLSMGAGSVLARAMGEGNQTDQKHTATYGILLAMVVVAFVGLGGLLTMDGLFRFLGAEGESLKLVKQYMSIWYMGCMAILMPPVGDSNLRATGDMVRPFIVMSVCAIVNVILDPLLIFGIGFFPEMGIRGASLATIIARTCGMFFTLYYNFRAGLLDLKIPRIKDVLETWKKILHVGIPSLFTQLLTPLLRGVLTSLAAVSAGTAGVAALAAGSRIESFPMIIAWAVNSALLTIIGQNRGKGQWSRIEKTRKVIIGAALVYGIFIFAISLFSAEPISRLFTDDEIVLGYTGRYLKIIFAGYGGLLIFSWTAIGLNALGRPIQSLVMNAVCSLLIMIPGAFIGHYIGGFIPMIIGLMTGQILSGIAAYFFGLVYFRKN